MPCRAQGGRGRRASSGARPPPVRERSRRRGKAASPSPPSLGKKKEAEPLPSLLHKPAPDTERRLRGRRGTARGPRRPPWGRGRRQGLRQLLRRRRRPPRPAPCPPPLPAAAATRRGGGPLLCPSERRERRAREPAAAPRSAPRRRRGPRRGPRRTLRRPEGVFFLKFFLRKQKKERGKKLSAPVVKSEKKNRICLSRSLLLLFFFLTLSPSRSSRASCSSLWRCAANSTYQPWCHSDQKSLEASLAACTRR